MSALIVALLLYALGCGFAFLSVAPTWQYNIPSLIAVSLAWPIVAALLVVGALIEVVSDILTKEAP